uniref:IS3 family transposase n=2 Tax=unclassified Deinococcus TaxID=2623546 RepID=UPI001C30B407
AAARQLVAAQVKPERACLLVGIPRSTWYDRPKPRQGGDLRQRMRDLALVHPRRGYRFIHALLVQEGHRINRKKVRRIWREEHLTVTTTRRKKIRTGASVPMQAAYPDHVWTYDTDSVCFVDNPEPHRVANSTPGTRFSPTRSARIERLCQPFLCTGHLAFKPRLAREMACSAA